MYTHMHTHACSQNSVSLITTTLSKHTRHLHSICRYFRSSIGGQLLTWASILGLAITALIALRQNQDIDEVGEEGGAEWMNE